MLAQNSSQLAAGRFIYNGGAGWNNRFTSSGTIIASLTVRLFIFAFFVFAPV